MHIAPIVRFATEFFPKEAQIRAGKLAIGARGTVRISTSETLDGAHSSGIVIPAFTRVMGGGASYASLPSFPQRKHNLGRENIVLGTGIIKTVEGKFTDDTYTGH